jgi:hypothetical protein
MERCRSVSLLAIMPELQLRPFERDQLPSWNCGSMMRTRKRGRVDLAGRRLALDLQHRPLGEFRGAIERGATGGWRGSATRRSATPTVAPVTARRCARDF